MAEDVTGPEGLEPRPLGTEATIVGDTPETIEPDPLEFPNPPATESDAPKRPAESADEGWIAVPPDIEENDELSTASAIAELRDELTQRLDQLQKAITQTTALQEHHAAMVQQLHAENQSLRQGELSQAMKPFLLDVARLHDDVERVIQSAGEELAKAAPIPEFILDVLDRHGVTQIRPSVGDVFDSKVHQGVKVAPTSEKNFDGKVESVVRPGFVGDGERLVRPAQVVVYRYARMDQPAAESPSGADREQGAAAEGAPATAIATNAQLDQTRSDDLG